MKLRFLFLTLLSLICFSVVGQSDPFQDAINDYMEGQGLRELYGEKFDDKIDVVKRNFKDVEIPEEVWIDLVEDRETHIDKALLLLSSAYRKHFSEDEINAMNEFYSSEAYLQYVTDPTKLTKDQHDVVYEFEEGEMGQKIKNVQSALGEDVEQISEFWGRDVFMAKLTAMVKLGYSNRQ